MPFIPAPVPPRLARLLPTVTQGELEITPTAGKASAVANGTTNASEETLGADSCKIASEEQEKQEGEKAETGEAGSGETAAASVNRNDAGHGHGAGVSLGSWEREGLRPLLEVRFTLDFSSVRYFGLLPLHESRTTTCSRCGGNQGGHWSGYIYIYIYIFSKLLCARL